MNKKIIFMPHANIQYSQLTPEKRLWVMENCYEKLFDLINDGDYKIAFEASGITIEEMAKQAPHCIGKAEKACCRGQGGACRKSVYTLYACKYTQRGMRSLTNTFS